MYRNDLRIGRRRAKQLLRPLINQTDDAASNNSVVEIVGYDIPSGRLKVTIPTDDEINPGKLLVVHGKMPGLGEGMGAMRYPQAILYDESSGTPATGQSWGTQTGSFMLKKGNIGFRAVTGSFTGPSALFFPDRRCPDPCTELCTRHGGTNDAPTPFIYFTTTAPSASPPWPQHASQTSGCIGAGNRPIYQFSDSFHSVGLTCLSASTGIWALGYAFSILGFPIYFAPTTYAEAMSLDPFAVEFTDVNGYHYAFYE